MRAVVRPSSSWPPRRRGPAELPQHPARQLGEVRDGLPGRRRRGRPARRGPAPRDAGLAGSLQPDRPYAAGSLVHYRYGAFVEQRRLSNDGLYAWVIPRSGRQPGGGPAHRAVPAPSWARCPFPDPAPPTAARPAARRSRTAAAGY
ncbi:hypothetical protein HBB16_05175 [Pseudonocardia sp. MCCB 268]|nr:hypothetical protein [Pseudonocardia cytotoxica]